MRLPRGTTVIICGGGGCVERVINDYGPIAGTNRIVDLYAPDFFDICGCPSWAGRPTSPSRSTDASVPRRLSRSVRAVAGGCRGRRR